ncbi:unnamed protein product [Pylaiella littoralis]
MNQLRRKLANLWFQREENDGDTEVDTNSSSQQLNGQNLSGRSSSHGHGTNSSSFEVPAALEIDAAAAAAASATVSGADVSSSIPPPRHRQVQHGAGGRRESKQQEEEEEEEEEEKDNEPAPVRLLSLSYPWGTSDPVPPPGWTSSSSRSILQQQQQQQQRYSPAPRSSGGSTAPSSLRVLGRRRGGGLGVVGDSGGGSSGGDRRGGTDSYTAVAADGYLSPPHVGNLPGAPCVATAGPSASQTAATTPDGGGSGGGRRRGRGKEEQHEDEEQACSYHNNSSYTAGSASATTKRSRAEEKEEEQDEEEQGDSLGDPHQRRQRRRQQQQASRRRRTCPADSTFVSPAAKRSANYSATTAASAAATGGATAFAVAVAADEDQEELEHRRSSTPTRLTFRAGLFKALMGGRAAAKRARSATGLRRKTRQLQAAIVRQTFHSAHPPPPPPPPPSPPPPENGDGRDDGYGGGGEREDRKAVRRRVGDGVRESVKGGTVTRVMVSARTSEDHEMWRRVNLAEEEHGKAADEKGLARLRRLKNLRAEALVAFGQAQEAHAELVATADAAFGAAEGVDMATLRSLFAEGANSPSSRFKDSNEVSTLRKKYAALETFLKNLHEAETAGDAKGLEALLAGAAPKNAQNQPEVVSAAKTLRAARALAEKARADKDAEDARLAAVAVAAAAAAAAAATAEAAEIQRAKDMVASLAAAEAKAEAASQAEAAAALAARKEGDELKALAEAAAMAASAADEDRFMEKIDGLKAAVHSRRAGIDEVLKSADPGVKKIRMGFKKSYQGCLNKLSATPATVRQVVRDIHLKAEAPLADARRAGWEAKAKEFLYFNLADKLVDYSERDHFSGDSYRMAFPLACVAIDLMAEHAGLSDLFLGTLYTRCPSAVPALAFDTAGLSDGEVMALLGQAGDEDMPAFLNRTKGLVVLMASIMQTPPHGGTNTEHPLPLSQGWCWLARFVNGLAAYVKKGNPPPVPTGPVLEWFLKVAGFELQRRYGSAFDKVVQTIKTEVLPILLPKTMVPHLLDVVLEGYEGRGRRFLPPAGRDKEFRHFRVWGDT